MPKKLIIAEKPSVANDLARVLTGFKKEGEYWESEDFVLSSAIGHLIELCKPTEYGKGKGKWSFESLPLLPEEFKLKVIERTAPRFEVLKKLLKRKDVTGVINACDAGREGELIFRYVMEAAECKKKVQRLWLQSMTPGSIRDGFTKLRKEEEMEPLLAAAKSRSESDWLVGINTTRALTALNSKGGGFFLTTAGRVQTPTLSILVERELQIRAFVPKGYWEVHATFGAKAGEYEGKWFDEALADQKVAERGAEQRPERLWTQERAEQIVGECRGKTGEVHDEKKPARQLSPLLYDLTSLQREGNSRFGLSARRTLQIAQALYEKHKAITYPRTDSRYLPEDYLAVAQSTLENFEGSEFGEFSKTVLKKGWLKPTKRVFNSAKVSDHFAIIPTQQIPAKLDEIEMKVYAAIVRRFIAVFYPEAVYEVTNRITRVGAHAFRTDGKILKEAGWLAVYGKEAAEEGGEEGKLLVPVLDGEKVKTVAILAEGLQTKPPARMTEATLLSAMEGAGKLIEDDTLREAMGERGLGTPATRAATIETLISEEYVRRIGRELVPTAKAFGLFETLDALGIEILQSPEMTGEWEHKLKEIEHGRMKRDEFMLEIQKVARDIVEKARVFQDKDHVLRKLDFKDPQTGQEFEETLREYRTLDQAYAVRKVLAGRRIEAHEFLELLEKGTMGLVDGFRSRLGRPFSAGLKLGEGRKIELVVGEEEGTLDFTGQEPLGQCLACGGNMFMSQLRYVCEHSVSKPSTCTFKVSKKILNRDITVPEVQDLLKNKKTALLEKFISNKTRRPFSAVLMWKDGKVSFDFPPREPRKPKSAKTAKARASAAT
ncbi:MAG: DNA topoisomerase III [Verrucomicrobia bacterium]|jgi:DNA topoisomerase-3|nr:DNA topoisomerase III [Verrucomicrobiota bacterium]